MSEVPSKTERRITRQLLAHLKQADLPEHMEVPRAISLVDFLQYPIYLSFLIREGLPYSTFDLIQGASPFSLQEWAAFLNMSYKSMQRYKSQESSFKPIHAERILEVAEVLTTGVEVFGDMQKFYRWLNTENYALGRLKPVDLLRDSYGKELVLTELVRIDHGIFA